MSNEKMREEFEAAYLKDVSERFKGCEVGDEEWIERGASGEYRSFRAAGAWWAWQASREALVIELPKSRGENGERANGCGAKLSALMANQLAIDECREALIAQGLKVK